MAGRHIGVPELKEDGWLRLIEEEVEGCPARTGHRPCRNTSRKSNHSLLRLRRLIWQVNEATPLGDAGEEKTEIRQRGWEGRKGRGTPDREDEAAVAVHKGRDGCRSYTRRCSWNIIATRSTARTLLAVDIYA